MLSLQDNLFKINKLPQNKAFVEIMKVSFFFRFSLGSQGSYVNLLTFQGFHSKTWEVESMGQRERQKERQTNRQSGRNSLFDYPMPLCLGLMQWRIDKRAFYKKLVGAKISFAYCRKTLNCSFSCREVHLSFEDLRFFWIF